MKEVDWEEANKAGINGTFAPKDDVWMVNCDSGVLPKVMFTDKNKPANRSDVITLTNPNAPTTAQGIGYQVTGFGGYQAYKMGTYFDVGNGQSASGDYVMPLLFRYIKTSGQVTPGEANAILDMTVTYR